MKNNKVNPFGNTIKRVTQSQDLETLNDMFDTDFPGLKDLSNLMHSCLGLAGQMVCSHPDLKKDDSESICNIATTLFEAYLDKTRNSGSDE